MDFTHAFHNIKQLQTKHFRYNYMFHSGDISIIANTDDDHFQLFVVISTENLQVCRQLNLYLKDDKYQFNAYWQTEYFSQIYPIIAVDNKLDRFWEDLIDRLSKITDEQLVRLDPTQYQTMVRQVTGQSRDTIYLSHLRKSKMSKDQFEKISRFYGTSVACKVQSMGCTLVFSSDPLKSHTIIIDDLVIK